VKRVVESPRQFAAHLRYAIQRAKAVEGKRIGIIQDELGYAIGRQGRTAIEHYLKEHIPPQLSDVETLGRELVRRARLDEAWLTSFLSSAGHPAPAQVVAELFTTNASPTRRQWHPRPRLRPGDNGVARVPNSHGAPTRPKATHPH